MPVLVKCHECHKEKACTLEPSNGALINFSFYRATKSIYICAKCEEKRAAKFSKIIENIRK